MRYDSGTCNRAISPQPKVANHATDTVIIKATNRKVIALLLVLAANMPFFPVQVMRCNNLSYERVFLMSRYFSLRHSPGRVARRFATVERYDAVAPSTNRLS
jgi:hypothetical protein